MQKPTDNLVDRPMTRVPRLTIRASALLLLAALALPGCSSTPTHFYTLVPPSKGIALPAQDAAFQIAVDPVDVPAQVDVQTLVVREHDGSLTPVETRRWVARLPLEINNALVAELMERLGVSEITGVAPDPKLPTWRIQFSVRRFDSSLGNEARLEAVWAVQSVRDPKISATCISRIGVPVAPGYEALAEGHQHALTQAADSIAGAVLAMQAGHVISACAEADAR